MLYSKIKNKNQITIPRDLIEKFKLAVGDIVEFIVRNNEVVLKPKKLVDAEDSWYWSKKWQKEEAESLKDIRAGKITICESVEKMIKELDK